MNKKLEKVIKEVCIDRNGLILPYHTEKVKIVEVLPFSSQVKMIPVKHFKKNNYTILGVGIEIEEMEIGVIYMAQNKADDKIYFRPYKMFLEECNNAQKEEYGQNYRFELVEEV